MTQAAGTEWPWAGEHRGRHAQHVWTSQAVPRVGTKQRIPLHPPSQMSTERLRSGKWKVTVGATAVGWAPGAPKPSMGSAPPLPRFSCCPSCAPTLGDSLQLQITLPPARSSQGSTSQNSPVGLPGLTTTPGSPSKGSGDAGGWDGCFSPGMKSRRRVSAQPCPKNSNPTEINGNERWHRQECLTALHSTG